ncbi:MAG: ferredoxin, partial [Helicobacter sp.]|nr:ferredoxin [Helicobacter sp.]
FVYNNKCVECVGHNDEPACASACPTEGCIVWDGVVDGQAFREDVGSDKRESHTPVVE